MKNETFPKVVFVGDSFIETAYAGERNRITGHSKKLANDKAVKYEDLNPAYSVSTTLHFMVNYLVRVMPLNPNHIFLFLGCIGALVVAYKENFCKAVKGYTPFTAPPSERLFEKFKKI